MMSEKSGYKSTDQFKYLKAEIYNKDSLKKYIQEM